jgi:AraC family transcriptional activator of pobA
MPNTQQPYRIQTIAELHKMMGLPRPEHPLISVVNLEQVIRQPENISVNRTFDFYSIALKRHCVGKFNYIISRMALCILWRRARYLGRAL